MTARRCFGILVASLVPTLSFSEEIPGSTFYSGNWEGGAYTFSDGSGGFSHCSISAYYPGHDASLVFFLSKEYTMTLGVLAGSPIFSGVTEFPVVARVDRRPPIYGVAKVAAAGDIAFLNFPDLNSAIETMKRGRTLLLESQYGVFPFSLEGTYRALDAAYSCAAKYYSYQEIPTVQQTETVGWQPTPEQTSLMYQIATKMISDAGHSDFQYLTAQNLVEAGLGNLSNGVAWVASDGAFFGAVLVGRLSGREINLQAENAADMASLTSRCAGDVASVNQNYDVEGFPTSELVLMCSEQASSLETTLMKINVNGVSVETITIVERPKDGKPSPEVAAIPAAEAAATAVSFVNK